MKRPAAFGIAAAAFALALVGAWTAAPPAALGQQTQQKKGAKTAPKQPAAKSQAAPGADSAAKGAAAPAAFATEARNAILMDHATGAVMFEKAADERVGPASMSKMMTAYLVFEQLKSGKLKMDDTLPISDKTWRIWNNRGSTMFIPARSRTKIEDLLRGIIVESGNDACVVLAEGLYGSEEAFAEAMNKRAKEMGLAGSHFTNSTGWPDPDHYVTARDLAILAKRLIDDFPEYYGLFAEKDFVFNNTRQGNRNPLLYKDTGADGIKTGHTEDAGYGLAASAIRGGRRIIMVVHGLQNMRHRAAEAERLLDWGYRAFANYALFKPGDKVGEAEVWLGEKLKVPLTVEEGVIVTLPRDARRELKVQLVTEEPVKSPVKKGAPVGKLVVSAPNIESREAPVVAAEDVEKLGALARVGVSVGYMLFGSAAK